MKDCRTCRNSTDQYFCKLISRSDVKEWSDKHVGNYADFTDDCPGYEKSSNRVNDGNQPDKHGQNKQQKET
jgi:hypothetical protein